MSKTLHISIRVIMSGITFPLSYLLIVDFDLDINFPNCVIEIFLLSLYALRKIVWEGD